MIRVLHIHTLPVISGSGINTFLTLKGLDRNTYEAALACAPGGDLIELVRSHGFKVWTFPHFVQPLDPVKDLRTLIDLTLFLRRNSFPIVHTHNSKAGFIGRLAARFAGVPIIVHTVHGFAFHSHETAWRRLLFRNMERLASHWCDKMIFISQPLITWAMSEHIVERNKVVKIYSGIELEHFQPVTEEEKRRIRGKWGIGEGEKVIGIVSKLWNGKGHVHLIEAFTKIKQEMDKVRLVIAGEGYLHKELSRLVDMRDLHEHVIFTGFIKNVPEILSMMDVLALPSFFEGMGRVLLEAMAMAKPVVASRVGGIPDLVEDGINGILIKPGDMNELKEALMKILMNEELALGMGTAGREKIGEDFSARAMSTAISGVYKDLMKRKGVKIDL